MTARNEIEIVAKALRLNNFDPVICVEKAKDAIPVILDMIPLDASLEMAGSMSVAQLGILDQLRKRGNKGLAFPKPGEFSFEEMRKNPRRDILLVSSNAVTLDGKLVNTDGMGNRVAGMVFGVKKVILLIGANKIVRDVEEALDRIQNTIAP